MSIIKQDPATNCIQPQDFDTLYSSTPYQLYQSYPPQRAYQTIAKEFQYKKADNYPLEDFFDVGYAKKELDEGNIFYITEKFNKVFVNFLSVKLIYYRCKSTFF